MIGCASTKSLSSSPISILILNQRKLTICLKALKVRTKSDWENISTTIRRFADVRRNHKIHLTTYGSREMGCPRNDQHVRLYLYYGGNIRNDLYYDDSTL